MHLSVLWSLHSEYSEGAFIAQLENVNKPQTFFNVLWTVHLSIILDNDQLDTQLLYFTMRLL